MKWRRYLQINPLYSPAALVNLLASYLERDRRVISSPALPEPSLSYTSADLLTSPTHRIERS